MNRRVFLMNSALSLAAIAQRKSPIVETGSGKVRGLATDGIHTFKGIPYGAPTGAAGRFLPASKPQAWTDVRDALELGPSSPQVIRLLIPEIRDAYSISAPASEDCLRLNVWTPGASRNSKYPVMFYMHGGGFRTGSGGSILYDGAQLARKHGVVVVTVNHRLGVLGFLKLAGLGNGRFADASNVGMRDLQLALEWVRDNIAGFGGDPGNVTIWGQSGGGGKTAMLTAWPGVKGLFHRTIIHSTLIDTAVRALTEEEAAKNTAQLLTRLGVALSNLDALQQVPLEKLLSAVTGNDKMIATGASDMSTNFVPYVDGKTLPRHPYDPTAPEVSAAVPILCGSVETESVPYTGPDDAYWNTDDIDAPALNAAVKRILRVDDAAAKRVIDLYKADRPKASNQDLTQIITGDNALTRLSEYVIAERKYAQGKAPVYMYYFNWYSPVRQGRIRAMHSTDLPFVFDHVDECSFMVGTGADRQHLAEQMSSAWVAFARSGNPNHKGIPKWEPFTPARRQTMVFNTNTKAMDDPYGAERKLLAELRGNHP